MAAEGGVQERGAQVGGVPSGGPSTSTSMAMGAYKNKELKLF